MPIRNSSPESPAFIAWIAIIRSVAPAPTQSRSSSMSTSASGPAKRSTTPSMPPSRTRRLEATPIGVTGTSAGLSRRKALRSAASAGWNTTSAGPPTRSQVRGAIGTRAR